eukprot:scaffold23839_cov100-Isochrysis_galbana.AAC.2
MYSAPSHSHAPRRPKSHDCARIAPSAMNAQSNGTGDFAVRHIQPPASHTSCLPCVRSAV